MADNQLREKLNTIVLEGLDAAKSDSSEVYTFMTAAHRTMREIEEQYGHSAVGDIVEVLKKIDGVNPASRILISGLKSLLPSRQKRFERILSLLLPDWEKEIENDPLSDKFQEASLHARRDSIPDLKDEIAVMLSHADLASANDVSVAVIDFLGFIGSETTFEPILNIALDGSRSSEVRETAMLTAARLSQISDKHREQMLQILFDDELDASIFALDALAYPIAIENDPFDSFIRKNVDKISDNIDFIDWCLDANRPDLLRKDGLQNTKEKVQHLPITTQLRLLRSKSTSPVIREQCMVSVSALNKRERLNTYGCASKFGLAVQRGTGAGALWLGHCGIFVGEDEIIDVSVFRGMQAVRKISWSEFKNSHECWGLRTDDGIDYSVAVNRAYEIASWRTNYDGLHNNQKGKWKKGWFCGPKFWETDCVGFVEHVYEVGGANPIEVERWPITPREQRDAMKKVCECPADQDPAPADRGHLFHSVRFRNGKWSGRGDVWGQIPLRDKTVAISGTNGARLETQFLFTTPDGHLWHTLRRASGKWSGLGDVWGQIALREPVTALAAAHGKSGETHFIFTTKGGPPYTLFHTIRHSNKKWSPMGDVVAQFGKPLPEKITSIAAASGSPGETQYAFTTADGRLFHTVRDSGGNWQQFIDVETQFEIPGKVTAVTAAGFDDGEVQFMFVTEDGHLWHTIRHSNKKWSGLGDVNGQFHIPGPVVSIAGAAVNPGHAQFLFTTSDGHLWHTSRFGNGRWSGLGDVSGQIPIHDKVLAVGAADGGDDTCQFVFVI
ncbi:MAG: hypothetical protein K2Y39_28995 [Candidatus Obscuribacterales bacterium]|nr:hypothetical protein [Candidatus Obscuribacterales bacterium]